MLALNLTLDLENASSIDDDDLPAPEQFKRWVSCCLQAQEFTPLASIAVPTNPCISIRLVDDAESQQLNAQYRHKNYPTNVLSFPCELPPEIGLNLLGDLAICAQVVIREAQEQGKTAQAHWAHMVIHGSLHLLGYDHIEDSQAQQMEALETAILTKLDFPPPYEQ